MKKSLLTLLLLITSTCWGQSSDQTIAGIRVKDLNLYASITSGKSKIHTTKDCSKVQDIDMQNLCLSKATSVNRCSFIKNSDIKSTCIAATLQNIAHCNAIKNKELWLLCKVQIKKKPEEEYSSLKKCFALKDENVKRLCLALNSRPLVSAIQKCEENID